MPKELFNQPLVETPVEPSDSDRIALGQPGVPGAKNILWGYLKAIIQTFITTFDKIIFNTGLSNPAYQEGVVFYEDAKKAISYYNNISGVVVRCGQDVLFLIENQTGVLIPKGTVIYPDVSTIIGLGDATDKTKSRILAVTKHDIANGASGVATKLGQVEGINTSSYAPGTILYLSDITPGAFTSTRPTNGNYPSIIGVVDVQDAVNGVITVDTLGFNGTDTEVNADGILNGIVVDTPDVIINSDGVTITATVNNESNPGNPIRFMIDGNRYFLPEGNSVTVPPGVDASTLQQSFLYIYLNASVPTLAIATSEPSIPYCLIAEIDVFNATRTQSDGRPFGYRRSNNAVNALDGSRDGALGLHIRTLRAIRKKLGSNWLTGQDATPTVDNATIRVALSSGSGMQFNEASLPAFDGLNYVIYNNTSNQVTYQASTNLTDITADATGATLLANNTFYTIRLFYLLNSNGVGNTVIATRPKGKYTTAAEAINDPNNYTVNINDVTIEEIIYPLYDIVISRTGAGGATISLVQLTDLRRKVIGGFGGGGASSGGGTDDKVRISATDTTNDYLNPKFTPGDEFTKEITSPAANETLTLKFKGWIYNAARTFKAILSSASLTADRTFSFPDKNGTFAMLDDIVAGSPYIIESNSQNSYAQFGTAGANEYLDIATYDGVSASKRVAQFGDGSTHSKLIIDPDAILGATTGAWLGDGDTGWHEVIDDTVAYVTNGAERMRMSSIGFYQNTTGGVFLNFSAFQSTTIPVYTFRANQASGLGNPRVDQTNIIAGAKESQRISEGGGRTSTILNGIVVETIDNGSTTAAAATLTKAGENFLTTVNIGDVVLVYNGTTTADYGTYIVRSVDSDTQITVDRNFTGSNSDVDFDIISKGTLIENAIEDGVSNIHSNSIIIDEASTYGAATGILFSDKDSYIKETSDDIIRVQSTSVGFGITPSGNSQVAINALPTSSAGLSTGDLFTQTATELGGSGTTKVLCIV